MWKMLVLSAVFMLIYGCGQNVEPVPEPEPAPPPEVQIGDSYETVYEIMGDPNGRMKAGDTMECLLYPTASITLTDSKVSKIDRKTPPTEGDMTNAVDPGQDAARRQRLITSIETRLEEQFTLYDSLTREEGELSSRLGDIDSQIGRAEGSADYYEIRSAAAKQSRLDWRSWRQRWGYDDYSNRPGSKALEKSYKAMADKYKDRQMSLENEQTDILNRLRSIAKQKEKIEVATGPDQRAIEKLRGTP